MEGKNDEVEKESERKEEEETEGDKT